MLILTANWILITYICSNLTERKINPLPQDLKSFLKKEDLKVYF